MIRKLAVGGHSGPHSRQCCRHGCGEKGPEVPVQETAKSHCNKSEKQDREIIGLVDAALVVLGPATQRAPQCRQRPRETGQATEDTTGKSHAAVGNLPARAYFDPADEKQKCGADQNQKDANSDLERRGIKGKRTKARPISRSR